MNNTLLFDIMSSMSSYHPKPDNFSLTSILNALGDPIRLSIVKSLAENGEQTCKAFHPDIPKSTLSRHFRVLREAGLIFVEPKGTSYLNSLRREDIDSRFPGLLNLVLKFSNGR